MNEIKNKAHQFYRDSWVIEEENNLIMAINLIDKAIELMPRVSIYWTTKSQYLFEIENYSEALNCISKALELKSNNYHFKKLTEPFFMYKLNDMFLTDWRSSYGQIFNVFSNCFI